MPKYSVPWTPRGIDFEPMKVGRPVIQPRALSIADLVHHELQRRRKRGWSAVYEVGDGEVVTPARDVSLQAHTFRGLMGRHTRFVRCDVLTLGAVIGSGTDPGLILQSTTDATGKVFARVSDAAAPTSTIAATNLAHYHAEVEVTPNTVESISIQQQNTTSTVRILSSLVCEIPIATVDSKSGSPDDAIGIVLDNFSPGTDIIDTDYDDLPIGVQNLRRFHKKLLWQNCKYVTITDVTEALRRELTTFVTGNPPAELAQWGVSPSVNLPETSGVSVTCAVLASRTGAGTGTVRFDFSASDIDVVGIAGIGIYSATGTINKTSDTLSSQAWLTLPGTLDIFGRWCWENSEAA